MEGRKEQANRKGKMLALTAAVEEELGGVRRKMAAVETIDQNGWRLFLGRYGGKQILLAQTGIGQIKAEAATRFLLENYPVSAFISFGFAGALLPDLEVGDLIVCERLHCGYAPAGGEPLHSDPELLVRISRCRCAATPVLGSSVTVRRLVAETEAKKALGIAFRAQVVDMEGYWIARLAAAWQIPFLAVRAVSDTLTQSLPRFDRYLSPDGELSRGRAMFYSLFHPYELAKLWRLYLNGRRASANLTDLLGGLIPGL
jgi:adenosylhomocysteine nucleosidase